MSFREYLREKIEETRHNEVLAYFMFLAGAIFFVGGILETLILSRETSWFIFIPYHTALSAGAILGSTLIISGVCLISLGIVANIKYAKNRGWYSNELRKANALEEGLIKKKLATKELE